MDDRFRTGKRLVCIGVYKDPSITRSYFFISNRASFKGLDITMSLSLPVFVDSVSLPALIER